ncbi:MAG: LPS-assembly protein LptD [Segetibacter sp.]|nr:LPS-assembly protein LptD [Segetibacter sp.]
MSKRCKVRSKKISAYFIIAIVFIITINVNGEFLQPNSLLNDQSTSINCADSNDFKNYYDTTKKVTNKTTRTIQDTTTRKKTTPPIVVNDTTRRTTDTTTLLDTSLLKDTSGRTTVIDTFNVKLSKDSLDAPITYAAEDSAVLLIPTRLFILYGKANTKYTDVEMEAAVIRVDQGKNVVTAYGSTDTLGSPLQKPKLVQGETVSNSDSIFYNLKSQKGLTKSTFLQEGEMFVYANTIKKVSEGTLFAWRGRFTTCNLDTPHFAFQTNKMKIINKKIAISGPTHPEIEGVPIPIYIPFGMYPLNRGRHSGLLPPQFAASEDFGLGLEGLGYYKVINEYVDLTLRSNIYSYGGWSINASPRYLRRYRYNGGLNLSVQNTKFLNRRTDIKEEFTKNKTFSLSWNHSRDSKARPGTTFGANVNVASTRYNRLVTNNALQNFQNQLTSSVNYSKDWRGKYNLSASANHSQNNSTRVIDLTLPNVSFNVVTLYPFQKAEQVGTPKWYEKLGLGYSGSLQNRLSFYDSAFNLRRLLDTAQWAVTHNIPITLSLPQLGPLQISPGVSYSERWAGQAIAADWDPVNKMVYQKVTRGFYTERQTNFSLSASTRLFGMYQFKRSKTGRAIRHEVRPTFSFNYTPDLNKGNYSKVQIDTFGNTLNFSTITGSQLIGDKRFGGISFGVDNTLEMKNRSKKDTGSEKKLTRLIDGFGFQSAYNLLADSFKLSPFTFSFRSTLFEKINITAGATLNPYEVNEQGLSVNRYAWEGDNFSLGQISYGSVAISTSFQSKSKDGRTDQERLPSDEFMTIEEQQRQLDYVRSNPAEYTDFNIPWNVQLSYSLSFSRQFAMGTGFKTISNSNLSVNGDFSLTDRWKMGGSTYLDVNTRTIQTLTMFVSREMHCWQLSINITPVGLYRSFNISLYPKSGILRDLKVNRSRFFYNQ